MKTELKNRTIKVGDLSIKLEKYSDKSFLATGNTRELWISELRVSKEDKSSKIAGVSVFTKFKDANGNPLKEPVKGWIVSNNAYPKLVEFLEAIDHPVSIPDSPSQKKGKTTKKAATKPAKKQELTVADYKALIEDMLSDPATLAEMIAAKQAKQAK